MLAGQIQAFFQAKTRTLIRMDFATRLDKAMKLAQADRKQLADALGVSVQAVGAVLTGSTKALTAENTAKAARFLAVDWYWLATGEGEARPKQAQEHEEIVKLAYAIRELDEETRSRVLQMCWGAIDLARNLAESVRSTG